MKKRADKGIIPWKELAELFVLLLKLILGEGIRNHLARAVIVVLAGAVGGYTGSEPILEAIPELFRMIDEDEDEGKDDK
ncbi:hypothetical protein CNR33_00061 [Pseudomonas phage tabernarius]|uniref:Uncharacterized protein n=1 Tax=Pseudomonas phage tabernarius TaxID=2048978 RepID=A0A2H4P6V4_9CAUD|nr:hypothetical protein FDJ17_gp61 [Pseudomonas phage tabernarius]ATW57907.1 hypothetical protein CNR33_00061 [Pseudomonas phage tabernarius]